MATLHRTPSGTDPTLTPESAPPARAQIVVRVDATPPSMRTPREDERIASLPRVKALDVLRGFAVLWVMLSHYQPFWNQYLGPTTILVPNSIGVYAVQLFFMISGFVIFMTLDRCKTVWDFAVLRFSRLYPTYWAALLIGTAVNVFLLGERFWPTGLLANLTMFEEYMGVAPFDAVYWSLTVELAFYINAACLFALGLHRRPVPVITVWLLAACLWAILVPDHVRPHPQGPGLWFVLDYAPFFAMGITFFDATKFGWSRSRLALVALAALAQFLLVGWVELLVGAITTTIFWLALNGYLRWLVSRVTVGLGTISYAVYVTHRNLGYYSFPWLHAHGVPAGIAVPLVMVGIFALATLITVFVERPAMAWIRRTYRGKQAAVYRYASSRSSA